MIDWEEVWCGGLRSHGGQWNREIDAGASVPPSSQSRVEKSVCCLPRDSSSGLNMKHLWQIFVLWGFWVLILWLMAPCLDPKPESAPQGKLLVLVLGHCNCPWFKFRKSGCPSETLNSFLCYHRVGEWGWYAECYGKMMEYLKRATESRTPHAVLWWLASGQPWAWSLALSFQSLAYILHSHQTPALSPGLVHL